MATKAGKMTVEIKADTRDFDYALRRIQSQVWWMKYGDIVTYATLVLLVVTAFLMGVVLSP